MGGTPGQAFGLSYFYGPKNRRDLFFDGIYKYCQELFSWIKQWDAGKMVSYLEKIDKLSSVLEKKSSTFLEFKEPLETRIETGLFVGLNNENRNPFSNVSFSVPTIFYSNGDDSIISGLKISHGFPASAIEGWAHWKSCAQDNPNGN